MGYVSIVTPPVSLDLTSLGNAASMVDADMDDFDLGRLITRASGMIAAFCHQPFGLRTVDEYFDSSCYRQPLILTQMPVVSIVSVTENDQALAPTDYRLGSGMLFRLQNSYQGNWHRTVTVRYTCGYDLPDAVPPEVESVCLALIQSGFSNRDPDIISEQVEGVGRVQYNPSSGLNMSIGPTSAHLLSDHIYRVW